MVAAASANGIVSDVLFERDDVRVVRTDYADGLRQPRHGHDFTSVSLVLSGAVIERVGSHERRGETLSTVVKRVGVEHACDFVGGTRMLSVTFRDPRHDDRDAVRRDWRWGPWLWTDHSRIAAGIFRVHQLAAAGLFEGAVDDLLIEVTSAIEPGDPSPAKVPAWVRAAAECLRARPERPMIRAIARDVGVHPVHLARAFRQHFGKSPTEYALWLRLRRASSLLASDHRSVGVIALDAGFADHSHLCREFGSRLGLAPTNYRRIARSLS